MKVITSVIKKSTLIASIVLSLPAFATDYYVDNTGSDNFDGLSPEQAFQSLSKLNSLALQPGDNIYLAGGQTFLGTIKLSNISGNAESPISISNFGDLEQRAIIDAAGELAGIELINPRHINVSNIEITADGGIKKKYRGSSPMRLGILVDINSFDNAADFGHITFDNLYIHDVYFEEFGYEGRGSDVNTPNGTQAYGWGVRLYNNNNGTTKLTNVTMQNSEIGDVAHTAFKVTSNSNRNIEERRWGNVYDVELTNNYFHDIGGPGIQFGGTNSGYVGHNKVHRTGSGSDSRKWNRGSGMWPWGSKNLLIEHNEFFDAQGPADSAGFHIDFNCTNIVVQYNLSKNNAGGFIEILGNNENNSYRYNVSVNDGNRKKGVNGASHDGKILWTSGYVGKNNPQVAAKNNYIYNNTVYVKSDQLAQFAVHNETNGLLVANNLFIIEGDTHYITQDIYNLVDGENPTQDILVTNNAFLDATDWPVESLAVSTNPIVGDPQFANQGGFTLADYIPANQDLISNQGIEIVAFADDPIGLVAGFALSEDILGNPITGNQHLGAIYPFDSTAPQADFSSDETDTTSLTTFTVTISFDELISDFSLSNLTVSNAELSNLIKLSDKQWQFDVAPISDGEVSIQLAENSVVDASENGNVEAHYTITYQASTTETETESSNEQETKSSSGSGGTFYYVLLLLGLTSFRPKRRHL
ncbi:Ig-like domain-containing protein [Thalassotalea crassostreae]|uniref:Ig-like domain-containing protein n=1 Tax=Thalassotalea crassostreae TaxID=1763536 RepID=UPI000838C8FE|nr:Ig-like domain-containing protein [Thalassotalea crassostreae]